MFWTKRNEVLNNLSTAYNDNFKITNGIVSRSKAPGNIEIFFLQIKFTSITIIEKRYS